MFESIKISLKKKKKEIRVSLLLQVYIAKIKKKFKST